MNANTNCPHYDMAMTTASTVGRNFKTLRENKRNLTRALVLAVADEGFDQKSAFNDAKTRMGWAKMEKDEKNNASVAFTACTTVILAWPHLADDVKTSFRDGEWLVSTLAKSIKDADKAREEAEKEALEARERAEENERREANGEPPLPTEPVEEDRSEAILAVAAMLETALNENEQAAMAMLFDAVEAYQLRIAEAAKQAA